MKTVHSAVGVSTETLERFAESCNLSGDVNVIHVTINIPFNDKSVPEKELLLQHSGQAAALYNLWFLRSVFCL